MEYPHLVDLYARRGGSDFTILSVETTNRPELAKMWVADMKATFPIVTDELKMARSIFQLKGVPTNILIDRKGRAIFRHLGFSPGDEKILEAEVEYLVGLKS